MAIFVNQVGEAKLFSSVNDAYWLIQHYCTKHQDINIKNHGVKLARHLEDGSCTHKIDNISEMQSNNDTWRNLDVGVLLAGDNRKNLDQNVSMSI
jgi:hypothetical protein